MDSHTQVRIPKYNTFRIIFHLKEITGNILQKNKSYKSWCYIQFKSHENNYYLKLLSSFKNIFYFKLVIGSFRKSVKNTCKGWHGARGCVVWTTLVYSIYPSIFNTVPLRILTNNSASKIYWSYVINIETFLKYYLTVYLSLKFI